MFLSNVHNVSTTLHFCYKIQRNQLSHQSHSPCPVLEKSAGALFEEQSTDLLCLGHVRGLDERLDLVLELALGAAELVAPGGVP